MAVRENKRPRAPLFTHGGLTAEGILVKEALGFFFSFSHTHAVGAF